MNCIPLLKIGGSLVVFDLISHLTGKSENEWEQNGTEMLMQKELQGMLWNCFITAAEQELMLHPSLTKRLANHARLNGVTEG